MTMNNEQNNHIQYVFLDSGIGGMPYFEYFHAQVPSAKAVYIADTKHFPYGEKATDEIIAYAYEITGRIIAQFNPDVIVIACNTMSVAALEALRTFYSVPFVGTVPAIKRAAAISKNKRIGLIATDKTIHDPYIDNLIITHAAECIIEKRGDSALVQRIETGLTTCAIDIQKQAIAPALAQFQQAGVDTLVLACTHFLHIADLLAECAAPDITIVDSREGVIKQTLRIAAPIPAQDEACCRCYVTGTLSPASEQQYSTLCRQFHLQWCGVLP